MKITTRFSPSPTGFLHIGGVRTALYSWLFARKYGGSFILRIEDTDIQRIKKDSVTDILFGLKYLGLSWDKGPIYQSDRLKIYQDIILFMLKKKIAYKCYCSQKRLEKLRKKQILNKKKPKYDKKCRNALFIFKKSNIPYVIRFKNPDKGFVTFKDMVRGNIRFSNEELDDLILQRSNGTPTYNFCVVVDDWKMNITHVIRGDDHINNTPRQINLLNALGAEIPMYAHASMILDPSRKKLSKRNNVMSLKSYIEEGFVPEAILNYIVRLGWSYKDKEIFSREEMISLFNLKSISKSPSILNYKKLLWLNHYYFNHLSLKEKYKYFSTYIKDKKIILDSKSDIRGLIKDFLCHYNTLKEFSISYSYFYEDINLSKVDNMHFYCSAMNVKILKFLHQNFSLLNVWNTKNILEEIQKSVLYFKIFFQDVAILLRIGISGKKNTPNISSIILYIGKDKLLFRINNFIEYIKYYLNK
ncbi:glutamate--tRNA ligase [Buchnera aphidicola]|uniref:Glutamate--tRNA ligase n=1 Tax=Buchnera aphidicola (Cinara strobi) TaxID=1921549 RepID=A0A3B1DZZ5_9GAMM|nr:glutamate--tRNA ligase [Buchnera aphidicola]VAX76255.1 Glutamate--tRNA ligase [Buchnera aphidicola (Cinara strobi)]